MRAYSLAMKHLLRSRNRNFPVAADPGKHEGRFPRGLLQASPAPHPTRAAQGVVRFYDFQPEGDAFFDEVLAGLTQAHKSLPARYLYDRRGAELFERVQEQPESVSARSELALMAAHARAISDFLGADCQLIELGAASKTRSRILLQELRPSLYVLVDANTESMQALAADAARLLPALNIVGVCADYAGALTLPEFMGVRIRRKAVYLPGPALNRFGVEAGRAILRHARRMVGKGGALLLGFDPMTGGKPKLEAACNDAAGAMAAFNLNLLARINRELGADFQLRRFEHRALWDSGKGQMEMHLVSLAAQLAHVGGERLRFAPGEAILTETRRRYSGEELQALARDAGFEPGTIWSDSAADFSLHGMTAV